MNDSQFRYSWLSHLDVDDARDVITLINSTVGDGGTLGYANAMSESEADGFLQGLQRRLHGGECHVFLGRSFDRPAFLVILTLNGMVNCRHRAELSKGVVHPDYRGHRLVQLAFREIVLRAEGLGVEQLVLDVREGSRAHALWQRFGFESYGILDDYARVDGRRHRGHFMVQTVASLRARLWSQNEGSVQQKENINA